MTPCRFLRCFHILYRPENYDALFTALISTLNLLWYVVVCGSLPLWFPLPLDQGWPWCSLRGAKSSIVETLHPPNWNTSLHGQASKVTIQSSVSFSTLCSVINPNTFIHSFMHLSIQLCAIYPNKNPTTWCAYGCKSLFETGGAWIGFARSANFCH